MTILEATLRLVPWPRARTLLVLGYPDIFTAADHVPAVLQDGPIGLEAIDDRLMRRHAQEGAARPLPAATCREGNGFLMAEFGGDTKEEADAKARDVIARLQSRAAAPDDEALRRSRPGTEAVGGAQVGAGRDGAHPGLARHVGRLGRLRRAARAHGRLPARAAALMRRTATTAPSTATSARAACTRASTST